MRLLERLKAEGLSLARQATYIRCATTIAIILGNDFYEADRRDVEGLMRTINSGARRSGQRSSIG